MAVNQVLGTDKTIRINNYNTLGLVQNFNWAPNFNAQDVTELGRSTRLDTLMELETSGSFDLQSAGNLAGLIARMKVKTNAGTGAFEGYTYAPTASGTLVNAYTYTQDDLVNLKFDVIQHEKTEQTVFDRSTYLACCYPTTFTGRVDANGMAMDTINWAGQYVVGFPKPFHDVRTVPCTKASATTVTTPAGYDATTWEVAYLTIDSRPVRKVAGDTQKITTFATNTITVSGITVADGVVVMAALFKRTPSTLWSTVHTPDVIGSVAQNSQVFGVRGSQANVYIAPKGLGTVTVATGAATFTTAQNLVIGNKIIASNGVTYTVSAVGSTTTATLTPTTNVTAATFDVYDANNMLIPDASSQWLKVQSMDYSIDLRVEALRQIAFNTQGSTIYHRAATLPFAMSVNATVNEADWADWKALLTGKTFTGTATTDVYNNAYEFAPVSLKPSFSVVIDYLTKGGTRIQQLVFNDCRVEGMGNRINIGGRGEVTWSFRGSQVTVVGVDIA